MASESAELLVTSDITKSPKVKVRRNSAGGNASSGNGDEKVVPNYLRASTGSCHDLCKYGREHGFASKERRSIPNRATRKKLHQSSEESIGRVIAKSKPPVDSKPTKMSTGVLKESVDSKPTKMSAVVLKESVDSKTQIPDALDTNEHELPSKSFDSQNHAANEVKANMKKTSSVEVKPSLLKSRTSPSTSQEISSSTDKEVSKSTPKKLENTSKPTSKVKIASKSTDGSVEAVSKSTLKKVENTSKVKTSSKSTSKISGASPQLSSLNGKEMKLAAKHPTPSNSNRVAKKKVSSSMNSSEGFDDKIINGIKTENKVASSKTASRKPIAPIKALSSPRASLKRVSSLNSRKHNGLKIVSHLRNQKTAKEDELEEHNNNTTTTTNNNNNNK
jgi:hypothetical protein